MVSVWYLILFESSHFKSDSNLKMGNEQGSKWGIREW